MAIQSKGKISMSMGRPAHGGTFGGGIASAEVRGVVQGKTRMKDKVGR
jgi:hypothetical protein